MIKASCIFKNSYMGDPSENNLQWSCNGTGSWLVKGPHSECSYFMPGARKSLRYAKSTAGAYLSFCSSCPLSLHSMKVVDSADSGQNSEEQKIRSQCTHFLYRWPPYPFYCCFVTTLILSLGYSVSHTGAWKRLYILSCCNTFLNTLIVPSVEWEQTERGLPRAGWGDACHGCVWMLEFVQAGRLPTVFWRSQREKVSVSLGLGSTCCAGLGEAWGKESPSESRDKWKREVERKTNCLRSLRVSWFQERLCEGDGTWSKPQKPYLGNRKPWWKQRSS